MTRHMLIRALVLIALCIDRLAGGTVDEAEPMDPDASRWRRLGMPLVAGLVLASMAINLWGVIWSRILAW